MTNRRSFLLGAATAALLVSLPTPAFALSNDPVENAIARTIARAGARQGLSASATTNIADKLGVTLGTVAPRGTPWLKLLAKASPIGRAITIISTLWLAYDAVSDMFNVAPQDGVSRGTWDGNNPRCDLNQVCTFADATGNYLVFTTYETATGAASWSYYGKYSYIKNVALATTYYPYKYQVWWKAPYGDAATIRNPVSTGSSDPKLKVAPGNLADYLSQFAQADAQPVGFAQLVNDAIAKAEEMGNLSPNSLRVTAGDVTDAFSVGSAKISDLTRDTPYDRDPQFLTDNSTGTSPVTDPSPTPTSTTGTGTGTGTGTSQCLPGSADCPAEVKWGDAPTVPDLADVTPNPFTPSQQVLDALPTGQCPTIDFTFMQKHIVVDGHCTVLESKRSMIWTLGNITGMLGAFRILMGS